MRLGHGWVPACGTHSRMTKHAAVKLLLIAIGGKQGESHAPDGYWCKHGEHYAMCPECKLVKE